MRLARVVTGILWVPACDPVCSAEAGFLRIEAYSNQHGAYVVVSTWSLEGDRLTMAVAMISRTTGATFSEGQMHYRRS